jgi:O-antigen/teichoic acid export membrane protein
MSSGNPDRPGRAPAASPPRPLAVTLVGNAAWSAARFVAGVLGALLTAILLARYLGPTEFGTYRLAINLVSVLEVVSVLAFPNATIKFVAEVSAMPRPSSAGAVIAFFGARATAAFLGGFLLVLLLRHPLARFYQNDALAPILLPAALAVLPGLWYGLLAAGLQGRQRFRALSVVATVQATVALAGSLLVVAAGGGAHELFVLAIALNTLGAVLAARAGGPELRPGLVAWGLAPELRRRMWRYGLALGLIAVPSALLFERLEVFFIGRFWTAADVGFYSVAAGLALHARRLGPSALGEALFPVISRLEGRRDAWGVANAYVHATRYLVMIGWPLALGGAMLAEPALAVLVTAAGLISMGHPAVAVIFSQERHAFLLASSLLVVLLNVALDLLLIPPYAALGAAAANTAAQVVLLVIQTVFVARWLTVRPPVGAAVRSLLAGVVALTPVAVVRLWLAPLDLLPLVLLALAAVVAYPWLLAAFGALIGEDITRLRAIAAAMPSPLRPFAGRLLAALGGWVRSPEPAR